jgi:hypothetical protein
MHMKIVRLFALVVTIALLCGCTNVPSRDAARISAAFHTYLSIGRGTTHSRVVALLGNEIRRDSDGEFFWETRYDTLNYASIRIRFDSRDRVQDAKVTRGWGVQESASQDNFVVEREK